MDQERARSSSVMIIREAEPGDAEAIRAIYEPYVLSTPISFEETPPTAEEMRARIESTLKTHPYLVAEKDGEVIGYAYGSQHRTRAAYRWSADVTVYVAPEAQGQGVGKALYRELLEALADRGYHAAFAGITLPNEKSVALHEAVGFKPVGIYREVGFKLGRWYDVGWWQLLLQQDD